MRSRVGLPIALLLILAMTVPGSPVLPMKWVHARVMSPAASTTAGHLLSMRPKPQLPTVSTGLSACSIPAWTWSRAARVWCWLLSRAPLTLCM